MKNIAGGSIQSRNGNLSYVVSMVDSRGRKTQKWVALKTKDMSEAKERVRERFGAAPAGGDEIRWLRYLVKTGQEAQAALNLLEGAAAAETLVWEGLLEKWICCADQLTDNESTISAYRSQVRALTEWAQLEGVGSPGALCAAAAQEYIKTRSADAQKRDAALFKRLWNDFEIPQVWNKIRKKRAVGVPYRRLREDEIASLCLVLRDGGGNSERPQCAADWIRQPDLLDLVLLGYYTALRRKDAVNLSSRNVDGDFLILKAFKTAHRGGVKPLSIPLIPAAREIVQRRAAAAGDDGYLFPGLVGGSLDKALRLSFRRAGVESNTDGKASFHSLRATFISVMDDAGVSGHITDAITGHKGAGGMHGHYSQPGRAALMAAVESAVRPVVI